MSDLNLNKPPGLTGISGFHHIMFEIILDPWFLLMYTQILNVIHNVIQTIKSYTFYCHIMVVPPLKLLGMGGMTERGGSRGSNNQIMSRVEVHSSLSIFYISSIHKDVVFYLIWYSLSVVVFTSVSITLLNTESSLSQDLKELIHFFRFNRSCSGCLIDAYTFIWNLESETTIERFSWKHPFLNWQKCYLELTHDWRQNHEKFWLIFNLGEAMSL